MSARYWLTALIAASLVTPAFAQPKKITSAKANAARTDAAKADGLNTKPARADAKTTTAPTQAQAPALPAQQPAPPAAPSADCDYVEIAATTGKDGSIDPDLKSLEKKLKKPPFTGWNTFKKLSGGKSSLASNTPTTLKLKQATATIMLRGRPAKVELTVTIDNAQGKRVLEVKPAVKVGDWLLLVASNAKDDGHILGLTCK